MTSGGGMSPLRGVLIHSTLLAQELVMPNCYGHMLGQVHLGRKLYILKKTLIVIILFSFTGGIIYMPIHVQLL